MKFIFATLHVKNLEESIQFYENVVGMKLARRFPGGPHTEIAFMADGPAEIELICNTEAEPVVYGECPSLGLSVEDLDQAMEHMKNRAWKSSADHSSRTPIPAFFHPRSGWRES